MKRPIALTVATVGVAVLAKAAATRSRGVDFGERIAKMPASSPRKWLFTNIAAIRENTDRILAIVQEHGTPDRAERTGAHNA